MAEAYQSRKRLFTVIVLLVVAAGAFIIVRPRLWVKNKTGKVIVDGRLSEEIKLFHGSDDRLLFYLKNDPGGAYVYDPASGGWRCEASYFASFKIIAVSRQFKISGCASDENGDALRDARRGPQSLAFEWHDQHIIVSWQAAPR